MDLRDKNVWLIGASTGIGAALVPQLIAEGAHLAISSRNEQQLRDLAAKCSPPDAPIAVHPLDVTEDGAIARAEAELRTGWGRIDVLIYNAGAWSAIDVNAWDVAAFESMIAVNYTGMMRAIAAVLPDMMARRSGEIVGVGSLSAYGAFPRAEAYGSTKAAVNYMLQALRLDIARRGVGVTTVNPGFVKTRLTDANDFPMPFLMRPPQAAHAIVTGMLAGKTEIHFPLRLSLPLKLVTALPRPLYEWLLGRTVKG
jgi:short-subunit dehydrogenase